MTFPEKIAASDLTPLHRRVNRTEFYKRSGAKTTKAVRQSPQALACCFLCGGPANTDFGSCWNFMEPSPGRCLQKGVDVCSTVGISHAANCKFGRQEAIIPREEPAIMSSARKILIAALLACSVGVVDVRPLLAQEKKAEKADDEKTELNKALNMAVAQGKFEAAKDLLKKGADIQWCDPASNRKTPLVKAVMSGRLDAVKFLIENGADINHPDGSGRYPVYFCCIGNNVELLKFVLAKGGDKDVNRGPFPMLVSLCNHGQAPAEFIPIIIKAGVSPDEIGSERKVTPLIAAIQLDPNRKPEVARSYVKALIENKADVNLKDKKEKMTPLQWAKKRGDPEIIDMLEKAGAKE
jgi:hypothetical protein